MSKAHFKPRRSRPKQALPTTLAYRIRTFGWIRNQPYHSTHGTHGDDAMLTVVRSGRGIYLRGSEKIDVVRGMVGLVLPRSVTGEDVGILMTDPDDPYDHDYCRFAGNQAMQTVRRILRANDNQPFFYPQHLPLLIDVMQQMRDQYHHHTDFSQQPDSRPPTLMEGMLASALAVLEMPEQACENQSSMSATMLRRYLQDHLAQPLSLDHMAEDFGVSKEHLCRVARQVLGTTLLTLAEQIKIDWATVLLHQPEMSIAEVGRRVGYVDGLYFSKVFRKQTGMSPRKWRQSLSSEVLPQRSPAGSQRIPAGALQIASPDNPQQ